MRRTDDGPYDQPWDRAISKPVPRCDSDVTQRIKVPTLAEIAAEMHARLEREGRS